MIERRSRVSRGRRHERQKEERQRARRLHECHHVGRRAIVAMSHEAPTVWIMLPNDDASVAHQNSAKARCSNGASVACRHCANRGEACTATAA